MLGCKAPHPTPLPGGEGAAQHLEPKSLAQLGWAGVGQNGATDIDRWDHAIAAVPLLDALGSLFVLVDIDLSIRDIMLVQEPLGDTAVASPRRGIDRHRYGHVLSFSLSVISQHTCCLIKPT